MTLTVGSLFSGIGGMDVGLERAGLGPVEWQVEIDPHARAVLARHWPKVTRHEDVRAVGAANLVPVDVVAGGFPCLDLSSANVTTRHGLDGAKSGPLWLEYRRIITELRPRYAIVENVSDGWRKWVPIVRGDLGRLGYASLPIRLRACDVGAPHQRARVFVVARADGDGESVVRLHAQVALVPGLADLCRQDWGAPPPGALGVADGVPNRVERLRGSGNAVMPILGEIVGRIIMNLEGSA